MKKWIIQSILIIFRKFGPELDNKTLNDIRDGLLPGKIIVLLIDATGLKDLQHIDSLHLEPYINII